jgi:hypothetical protein
MQITDNSFVITPDKILSLANNYISRYGKKITYNPEENIIFLHSDNLPVFINEVLPNINYKFVLLTHDSDWPITEKFDIILNNPYLIKWFAMNCHTMHEKLQPIPIGMANEVWPHGNKDILLTIINENNEKKNLVYCNFDPYTNLDARSVAIQKIRNYPYIDFDFNKISFEEYLRKLSTYKYVISPPGNSTDCHRIWESIYLGTVPICLKSIPLVYFKDCPILFINEWEDLNVDLLNEKYKIITNKSKIKSDFNFYKKMINEAANIK